MKRHGECHSPKLLQYRELPERSIRLLRIGSDHHAVGPLEVVSLDAAPTFYALSHCWGTKPPSCNLQLGAENLAVRPDLAAGVARIRELAAEEPGLDPPLLYVWIDTICINQEDLLERSSQVQLMGEIYSLSARTLIWLGPHSPTSSLAWELLDRIYGVFGSRHPLAEQVSDIPVQLYSDAYHAGTGLPPWDDEAWLRVKELLELDWFSRVWVIQEVVLSRQDPLLLHGEHTYPWHRLGWAVAWLRRNGYTRLPRVSGKALNNKFRATDQRDKIYGLLGLAAESREASGLPGPLRPDYSLGVAETYQKVARFLLERSGSLAMMTRTPGPAALLGRRPSQLQGRREAPPLPSWTPDWSDVVDGDSRVFLSWVYYSDASKPIRLGYPEQYDASAGLPAAVRESADESILRVGGVQADTVTVAVPFNPGDHTRAAFDGCFAESMARVCDAAAAFFSPCGMGIGIWAEDLIRAITVDQHHLVGHSWEQSVRDGSAYLRDLLQGREARATSSLYKEADLLEKLAAGGNAKEYEALARSYCFNRSFITTSGGRMGIGPSETEVGDTVSVILGGGVPYITRRRRTDCWLFVGEAYVNGLMNGEAVEACRLGTLQEEDFNFY
ncbi:hypothetical protein MAPG_10691 [Magnaporthiopsis poae ATCC 64411]|uniref:Heterokaryon incompatibility domain-containing protein n=1 Tax=Magnaporthiopsis poae (strain ATCC 64411 / 73-15) TaxID=644358 RepID=A0A0C4ED97_MAGP6|nr:hypothetical protein MAPG_10691 [Magnaporthiopsis poae ATCC 64411]